MHYAEFAEDEVCLILGILALQADWMQGAALLAAIKEYEASKWKVIGAKVGKPPKVGFFGSRGTSTTRFDASTE